MNDEYVNVVGITFKKYGKKYYFDCHNLNLRKNLTVIVETERGLQFGTVITDIIKMDKKSIHYPLKSVIRVSTKKDYTNHLNNIKDAKNAYKKCNELIKKYNLDMKLVDVNYTFERTQLFFTFIANDRVDFRDLAKDLAKIYKTRIELRQIGVRDEVRKIGGNGVCGRELCCCSFLNNFDVVSIKMAKEQSASLNPSKISGNCGRLMCCLKYEQEVYEEKNKRLPKVGAVVKTEDGKGTVCSVETLREMVKVQFEREGTKTYKSYNAADVKVLKNPKGSETENVDKEELENLQELQKLEKLEKEERKNVDNNQDEY